jgi:multisubunit Na+/H+ antiporter MnhC subunit
MEVLLSIAIGVLTTCGVFLILRSRTFPVLLGLTLLSYAVNLFLFASGRLRIDAPPLIRAGASYADPLPQALVLTAIVIGFGMTAYLAILALRACPNRVPTTSTPIGNHERHAPILPILIPLAAALLQMASGRASPPARGGLLATALLVLVTGWLTLLADDGVLRVYALGDWPAPFGIVLVVDRLAAAMTLLTAVLGFLVLLYASAGFDEEGIHFHPLFQFQLLGLLGAFLTGDLFNLFVFFEIMLLASYVLLAHGGGLTRTRAGISYVVLNLVGSALFLIALGLIYGTLGTLNLADVARVLTLPGYDRALARLAFALLIAVFALKAGLLPLSFWLPHTYSAAGAPVAALFAIMTKVGIVAILRVQAIALEPVMPDLLDNWLTTLALATVAFAALGALAASRLHALVAWLVLLSAGTLLVTPAQASAEVTPRRSTTCCNRRLPALLSSCLPASSPSSAARSPISSWPARHCLPPG